MLKKLSLVAALLTLSLVWVLPAQNAAQAVIDNSMKAHGVSDVKTLTIYGEGADGFVGQVWDPKADFWRRYSNRDFVRGFDFEAKAFRTQRTRGEGNNPPGGGAGTTTPAPTQQQDQVAQANNNFNNSVEMAMTPIGFLKFAAANSATVSQLTEKGKRYTVLSIPMDVPGATPYKTNLNGYINQQGLVEKVDVMVNEAFLGDIKWEATFTNYKDFGGVRFPANIVQRQYEPKIFELAVSDVKINAPVELAAQGKGKGGDPGGAAKGGAKGGAPAAKGKGGPGAAKGGGPAGPEDLGNGFWLIRDGYGAIVADYKDYIVVVEGPQNYERGETIIREAKRLIPNKPIRYVINTHSHFDHTSGLRPFVAEGATIVTHNNNKGYFEKVLLNPHTLVPDAFEKMANKPNKVKVEYVGDKKVYTDGTHTIETYYLKGSTHSNNMLIVYLPQQKLLLEGDEYNVPGTATTAPVPNPNSYQVNLLEQIEKLKIDVQRIVPVHLPGDNRAVSIQELRYMAGRAQ